MDTLTIGRLADRARVGVETIRFYEREGLLTSPPRTAAGYRLFAPEAVDRLRFIRRSQELGFSLSEIRELLTLRAGGDAECSDVRLRTERKLESIEQKIRDLQSMRRSLLRLRDACDGRDPASECAVLDALSREPTPESGGPT